MLQANPPASSELRAKADQEAQQLLAFIHDHGDPSFTTVHQRFQDNDGCALYTIKWNHDQRTEDVDAQGYLSLLRGEVKQKRKLCAFSSIYAHAC